LIPSRRTHNHARARTPRALALSPSRPPHLLPRRRCATALASKRPLASLRLAGGSRLASCTAPSCCAPRLYLSCYLRPASADFALGYPGHGLPAVCAASFARGFAGYVKASWLASLDCTPPSRGKFAAARRALT